MALISGAPALMSREIEASDWSELVKPTTGDLNLSNNIQSNNIQSRPL
jgi:hypothetical protein